MPTGYTAAIKDGIDFETFVWGCARGMGALVMMRDEPSDAKIPEKFEPSDYHTKALAEAKLTIARLMSMPIDEADREAVAAFVGEQKRHLTTLSEKAELRSKYEAMLAQVSAWKPPSSDHTGFKAFMLEQLSQSIEFDCNTKYYLEHSPVRMSGLLWKEEQIAEAHRSIAYHTKELAAEVERTEKRNQWIAALRKSLGAQT